MLGYEPEVNELKTQIPESTKNFVIYVRYNRKHYSVKYNTKEGTEIPNRTLYYEQRIPKLALGEVPTKLGSDFLGWMPSVDLETTNGKTYKANEIIKVATGTASTTLDANLIMPASDVTFTAVWKDKPKADYAVQFWAEKADHVDNATTAQKYEYMGTRVYKDAPTGTIPNLDKESPGPVKVKENGKDKTLPGLNFPDLDKARLAKIWNGATFNRGKDLYLNKFFVYNKALTDEQNKDPENANLIKSVSSTGQTVYNIYYDRQVYELYFTKSNALPTENTFYPEIWGYDETEGEVVKKGGPGNPYHYKARFNQLMLGWPNDAMQTKGFDENMQSFGWGPNFSNPNWPTHLDTPPYRLNADEFLDMTNYDKWGGYTKKIDKGDGSSINLNWDDYKILSFGIKQAEGSMPHHMDFWMDGFKDTETIIRYDLYRYKADTNSDTYSPRYPKVQGFTGKGTNETPEYLDSDGIDAKNDEREDVTPFPAKTYTDMYGERPVGKMQYIKAFFNNGDEWGDPDGWDGFNTNGYLKFEYSRNKYPLRFNYDPLKPKDDSEFDSTNQLDTFYEFPLKVLSPDLVDSKLDRKEREYFKDNPKNLLDNPENLKKLGLTDLVETKNKKLIIKRPEGLADQMEFKGWALDPAGTKLIWANEKETMPSHPVNLYAKWGPPDTKWTVTLDPNGGELKEVKAEMLTTDKRTIAEGDINDQKINTYPKKEANDGDKQKFTVIHLQKLKELPEPKKDGFDFMGWEFVRYEKDKDGKDTINEDKSYFDTYKASELYTFGNEVVSNVHLRAIWIKNELVDVELYHHFLDKDYKEIKGSPEHQTLKGARSGSYLGTVASRQDEEWLLAPDSELADKHIKAYDDYINLTKDYTASKSPRTNTYNQYMIVTPEEVDANGHRIKSKENEFHFFYRRFRKREYTVKYIDERYEKNPEDAKASIIPDEKVVNGNHHTDARNYRPIPGWVLADVKKSQQQLFFDVDEKTNEFLGINKTGKKYITFIYKDVRVIETKKDAPVPDGYVRVTFKAADGGSFTDKAGNAVKELYYDVVKGLRSQLLPVPKLLGEGETKVNGKYYITPDNGKNFTKWDKDELLNDNTILEQNYEFTAYFDWSDLKVSSKELVSTESYIDPDDKWTNEFAPTIDELKNQLVLTKNNQVINNIDEHIVAQLFDEKGKELKTDEDVLKLLSEQNKSDTEELVRRVNIKAKVKFKDQKYKALENEKEGLGDQLEKLKKEDPVDQTKINELEQKIKDTTDAIKAHEAGLTEQELDIPVTIYKNVYEALTKTEKPLFLSEAEKGDLKDITGDYVKVTVQPTNKPTNKDAKIYYVNPYAWVKIKEVDISKDASNLGFTKWTADKDEQNEKDKKGKSTGVFDFTKRHMFTKDTVITPDFSEDVKEQKDGADKPDVPGNFVKVIVDKTANAELGVDEKQTQTFWVNPTKEVTIPVSKPTGKTIASSATNPQQIAWIFDNWTSDKNIGPWTDTIKAQFTEAVTTITANYKQADNIIPYDPEEPKERPEGYVRVKFDADPGLKLTEQKAYYVKKNSGVKLSDLAHPKVDPKTGYKFDKWNPADTTEIGHKDITVTAKANKLDPVIPDDGNPNTKPKGYVEVVFVIKAEDAAKGSIDGVAKFFVKPNEYVKIDPTATKAETGYEFGTWDKNTTIPTVYKEDTTITGYFNELKAVIPETNPDGSENKQPAGYKTVTFEIDPTTGGKIKDGEVIVYYVNPAKDVTVPQPKTQADTGYEFDKWDQDTAIAKKYTDNTTVKGNFKKLEDIIPSKDSNGKPNAQPEGYVTVTFTKGTHGSSITGETIFYVNPTANKTIANITTKPTVIPDTGYAVNGWDKADGFTITEDTTVNAKFDNFDNVIPKYKDDGVTPNDRPNGYIEVTFDPTDKATDSTKKVVYVKPNTAVILKGYEPKVTGKANYEFSDWNVDLTKKTEYEDGTKITALYNDKGDIKTSEEPGYVKVEFKTDDRGKLVNNKGILVDTTELWIAPNKEITIPDPSVIPNAGHTFTGWDKKLTVNLPTDLPAGSKTYVITAQYDNADNIIPKIDANGKTNAKPEGYVTVTFRADDNGKLVGDKKEIVYYVNPKAGIKIVDTTNNPNKEIAIPNVIADKNYELDKWYESIDKDNSITTDLEYVARFNKGKVTLTYDAGEGTGTPPITVIVDNGTKVRLASATGLSKADASFKGWSIDESTDLKQDGDEITLTKDTKAVAQWTTDKDIIEYDPVNNPTTRPDDTYVRVTFEADNGLTLTEQKAYYVKKNAGKIIKDLTKPGKTAETGYEFKEWNFIDSTEIKTDIVVKALAKPIGDTIENKSGTQKPDGYVEVKFVAGENGSVEEKSYFVNPNKYVTLTPPTKKANTGFEFGAWSPDPSIPTVYKKDKTIEASFNGLKDVIPKTKTDESEKPDGYVTVTFEIEGKGGSIAPKETTVYYVKPNTKVTIDTPKTIAKTGYKFNNWEALTKDVSFDKDKTIKGSFTKLEDIIPAEENGTTNAQPDGYITVTFEKGEHGTLTGQTVYYVNPEADPAKTLGDQTIVKPEVKSEVGYKFTGWDTPDTTEINKPKDIVVKAQYTPIDDVIVKTADNDSEKPEGYITVTFDTVDSGKGVIGSTIITKKVLFVNPDKAVKLTNYKPEVNTKTGYKFARWDVSIDKAIQYKKGDVIHALYNEPENISTTEVYGYVKVEFKEGKHGSLTGTTEYWIKPGVQVNIPVPTVDPNVGYKFDKWDNDLTVTAKANDPTYVITAGYTPLDDIIPQKNTEGLDRPDGYVTVTFKGEHGTLVEPTIYYVNPNKQIWLYDDGFTDKMVKKENADIGYTSRGGKWDVPDTRITITKDETITYKFKKLDDVIEKIDEKTEKPKGYVIVTLIPTDKAKDEPKENKENKIYFVNPLEKVTLPEFKPTGKEDRDASGNKYTYEFNTWTSISGVLGSWPWINGPIKGTFTQDTDIEARYTKTEDLAPIAKENVITPVGVKPDAKDLIKNVYDENDQTNKGNLPKGTTFEYAEKPNVSEAGDITAKVKVIYPNGNKVIVEVPIKVVDNVIPQEGEEKPNNVPKDFVKVTFVPTDKGTMEGAKIFWVKPNENVKIPVKDPVGVGYNIFKEWKLGVNADGAVFKANKDTIFTEEETIITATYIDSDNIIPFDPKAENPKQRPDGYIRVTFDADLGLKLTESKAYYVKKNAGITIKQLTKPKYQEASGYKFDKWDKDDMFEIKEDIVVTALAKFTPSEPGYPEVIYRDKIVEKEKIVEKIVKVGENDELLKEIRYMQGYNGKFRPYDGLTRAEAAQILANALKADGYRYDAKYALSYSDIGSKWYTDAVRVVTQANVFQGYSDGTFRPQSKITRAEWVATLRRFQDLKKANGNAMMLKNGHWATAEVEAAYEAGWLGVYQDGTAHFDADKPITRQEVAYVSNRAFRRVLDKVYLKRSVNTLLTYKDINPSMPLYEDILCASNTLLTDNRYYKANTVVMDNLTFNIVTDYLRIQQKKFQYNVIR